MSAQDTTTRTVAGVAAVVAILALILGVAQSSRSGLIAEFAGTTKQVSEQNDAALQAQIQGLNARIDALQKKVEHVEKSAQQAAAAAPAEPPPE